METVKKAGIEALRVIVLAVIPVLISGLQENTVDMRVIGVVALIAFLRFVDKLLHEQGKILGDSHISKGLTRF